MQGLDKLMTSDLVILGHSHISAMGIPLSAEGDGRRLELVRTNERRVFTLLERWTGDRHRDYWTEALPHCVGRTVAIVWQGNQHQALFMFSPRPYFDFVLGDDESDETYPNAQMVPRSVFREALRHSVYGLGIILKEFRNAGVERILIVGTPPPKRDAEFILERVCRSDVFKKFAANAGVDLSHDSLTPPPIMVKLWKLVQHLTRETALDAGAEFVPVPMDTMEPDGTLRREFWADVTHANSAFGSRMYDALLNAIERHA
jgi:hypothetical protein